MEIAELHEKIKEQKPLVHHITNWVTIYDCANIVRCTGALPVMAHAKEEVEQMTGIASSLVLNIGTLTPTLIESMVLAAKTANKKNAPVVLDAVGVGATDLRTKKALELIEKTKIGVIKGNSGEIGVLAGAEAEVRGVEAMSLKGEPVEIAKKLALQTDSTVVITGKQDIVSNGEKTFLVSNGDSMLGSVVGTGCMAASVIGCFAAVEKDLAKASAGALSFFGIAGEVAAKQSSGPGTFKERFFDAVYSLDKSKLDQMQKISVV